MGRKSCSVSIVVALVALNAHPCASLELHNVEVAQVRDELVSFLELTISRMNATSALDACKLVHDVVDGTSRTTGLVVGKAGIKLAPGHVPKLLNSTLLAGARGQLVSHLEVMIGKMNSTAKVEARTLVADLIDEMSDVTEVPSGTVPLAPGFADNSLLRMSPVVAAEHGVGLFPLASAFVAGACLSALVLALVTWSGQLPAERAADTDSELSVHGDASTGRYSRVVTRT
mmetsp:Transcript_25687/g.66419  ORF Transcript_25687/g.66419 Transcript_25687/m.66419 type:complete len:230 (+) Transcript_25687:65-754(+)